MAGDHHRNIAPMMESPRCGARTRKGTPCDAPSIRGRARCRMHGGKGSGAPPGNRNAVTHGQTTIGAKAERKALNELIKEAKATLERFEKKK